MKVRVKLLAPWWCQREYSGTMINVFDVHLMVKFRLHLRMHLELHVKVHLKIYTKIHKRCTWDFTKRCTSSCIWVSLVQMHKSMQYDSVKGEIQVVLHYTWKCIEDFILGSI